MTRDNIEGGKEIIQLPICCVVERLDTSVCVAIGVRIVVWL